MIDDGLATGPGSAADSPVPAGDDAVDPVLRMHKDVAGVIRHVDEAVTRMLGWRPEDLVGRRSLEFVHPRDHDKLLANWARLLAVPGSEHRTRVRHSDTAGRWIWFEITNHNLLRHPTSPTVLTEMVRLAEVVEEDGDWYTHHLLHRLTETLPVGILEIDRDGRTVFTNARLAAVLGRPATSSALAMFADVVEVDRDELEKAFGAVLGGQDVDLEVELSHAELGQRRCAVQLRTLTDPSGRHPTGAVLCVSDVTEQARAREEMRRRAAYDGLTGCLNRVSVLDALSAALMGLREQPDRRGIAVMFIDLDHFKQVNDRYGHAIGDELLQAVAERVRSSTRISDSVGRLGGDEFLVVCPDSETVAVAMEMARRVALSVRRPLPLHDLQLSPSASIGLTWTAHGGLDVDGLVAAADRAMYQCKRDPAREPVLIDHAGPTGGTPAEPG